MATSSRRRNPRGEGAKLREQLVAATAEVLDEVGDADRISVRAIAKRAGVSPTALYLHFPDRDALVDATVDAGFAAFNDALLTAAGEHDDPRAALAAMGRAYLRFAAAQPALYAVLFSARRPLGPSPPKDGRARREPRRPRVAPARVRPGARRRCQRPEGARRLVGAARLRDAARRARRDGLAAGRRLRRPRPPAHLPAQL